MDLGLKDKVALITGSSRGIGKAIAKTLHQEGCQVMINGRTSETVNTIVDDLKERVSGVIGDVSNEKAAKTCIKETINTFGALDILVCNVGQSSSVPPGTENQEEFSRILQHNLLSTTNMVIAGKSELQKSNGSIVCISSICGVQVMPGAPSTYSAAKAAIHGWVRSVARPLAVKGVRINTIAPGNIVFEGSVWYRMLKEDPQKVQKILKNEVAMNRLGKLEEVADFVAFLSSPRASFCTGGIYLVDGGQSKS